MDAGVNLNLFNLLSGAFKDVSARGSIEIGDASLIGKNIRLNTLATTNKFAGFDLFENDLLNFILTQDLAEFNDPSFQAELSFDNATNKITIDSSSTTLRFNTLAVPFEAGMTIKVINSDTNDADDYVIDSISVDGLEMTLSADDVLQTEGPKVGVVIKQALTSLLPDELPLRPINADGTPIVGAGTVTSGNVSKTLLQTVSELKLLNFVSPAEVVFGTTESTIVVGTGATLTAVMDVEIAAIANSDLQLNSMATVLGITWVESEAKSSAKIETGAMVTAGGDFKLQGHSQNAMTSSLRTQANLFYSLAGKFLKVPGASSPMARA